MSCLRAIICLLFPPAAVIDKGCGPLLIVSVLTVLGIWIGGVLAALIICYKSEPKGKS